MIEINDLTVRFGGVTPLDHMTITFGEGTNGLIGPNGAGKTTFFNVLSGFVRPAEGSVTAFGEDLFSMAHFRRARWGVCMKIPPLRVGSSQSASGRPNHRARARGSQRSRLEGG